jgi:predicted YcjX-like family ATPase
LTLGPSLIAWKTDERRIGVLGPGWSGKTVFLTSLINHLSSHDPRHFHLGKDKMAEIRKFRRLPEDRIKGAHHEGASWPAFEYDQFRERLVHRRWPKKTSDCSQYVCRFERTDWKITDLILKLYDLPGERINDLAMVRKDSNTFETWSDTFIRRINRDIGYADRFEAYFKRLDDPNLTEEDLLRSYKVTLGQLRLAYKPYISPSTYLLDRKGEVCRGRDPEKLAEERYVGLGPKEEFAPLPKEAREKHGKIARLFAERFEIYRDDVVAPLIDTLQSCHGLVILVDVLRILASDTGTHDDYEELLRDMLHSLNPSEDLLHRGVRIISKALLPHQWRPSWINRIAFVAPKADLVHPEDRNRLKHLLRKMTERYALDLDGVKSNYFNVAAVRATEAVPGQEAKRMLAGATMLDAEGRPIDPGERQKFVVSPLPDEWPRQWKVGDFVFPSVYPEIPQRKGCPPDQFGLDAVFDFLCY